MRHNTSSILVLRKTFKRSRKELRKTLRALYRKNNQGPSGALHNDTNVEIAHS